MLCQFLLNSKVNQLYIYIYPLFFRFFSHLGHYRVLSRVPCAVQQILMSYLFYIQYCVYVNPNLPIYPSPLSPLITISLFSTSVILLLLCSFLLYNKVNQLYVYIYPHIPSLLSLPPTLPIPPLQVITKHQADLPVLLTLKSLNMLVGLQLSSVCTTNY